MNVSDSDYSRIMDSETVLRSIGEPTLTEDLKQRQDEDDSRLFHIQQLSLTIPIKLGLSVDVFTR